METIIVSVTGTIPNETVPTTLCLGEGLGGSDAEHFVEHEVVLVHEVRSQEVRLSRIARGGSEAGALASLATADWDLRLMRQRMVDVKSCLARSSTSCLLPPEPCTGPVQTTDPAATLEFLKFSGFVPQASLLKSGLSTPLDQNVQLRVFSLAVLSPNQDLTTKRAVSTTGSIVEIERREAQGRASVQEMVLSVEAARASFEHLVELGANS